MQSLLLLIVGKIVEVIMKKLIEWGEKSIAKQEAVKKKMEEYQANRNVAVQKAEEYEQNPNDITRNNIP